ncbi:hypothetical protein C5167_006840 [Papaver somniferum]|uniref:HMA domain-containing protein n=1 Tax=Papaver somniferum TaxID=3469 RepID=A0A4Y7JEF9_PAPSO|nr:heavy metal-associated isoprenylated plant protein 35-like [Papaver somniferum]RZC59534.1 hypothetical protein C5167_006840 [Papaver somniferum]
MATKVDDAELKRIDLKVSVNCCDGCKRKVKKLLQTIEGVLKIEIDSREPKVRVIGNVDPRILIKKLMRAGKHAELLACTNNSSSNGKSEPNKDDEKVKNPTTKPLADNCENKGVEKCPPNSSCTSTAAQDEQKSCSRDNRENPKTADGSRKKRASSKHHHKKADCYEGHTSDITGNTLPVLVLVPETIKMPVETPSIVSKVVTEQDDSGAVQPEMVHQVVEPLSKLHGPSDYSTTTTITDSYALAPQSFPSMFYYGGENRNNYGYRMYEGSRVYARDQQAAPIIFLPELQPPVPRVGDYFSVENTVGCQIM